MGTRNLTVVVLNGEVKVAQYGQWDGYPSGQGKTICDFIQKKMKIRKFKQAVKECYWIDENEVDKTSFNITQSHDGWMTEEQCKQLFIAYPTIDRDIGGKVLEGIQDYGWRALRDSYKFGHDSLFCEWAYVLDLDKKVLEVHKGFNKEPNSITDRWATTQPDGKYYGVSLYCTIPFKEANSRAMEDLEESLNEEV